MKLVSLLNEIGVLRERNTFSHIAQILGGKNPKIQSYALMTAENPYGEEHGSLENKEFNTKLENELRRMGKGFVKVQGQFFGNTEHSLFIPNISQDEATALGKKFGQFSIIQGEKNPQTGQMVHKYIEGGEVTQTRKTFAQLAKDVPDMFSKVQGRKFKIPFFSTAERGLEYQGGKRVQGSDDVEQPLSDKGEKERQTAMQTSRVDYSPMINLNGRRVWVHKKNIPTYLQQGYRKDSPDVKKAA